MSTSVLGRDTRTWICLECGATRAASAKLGRCSRRLKCANCGDATFHTPVLWDDDDYRETANANTDTALLLRQIRHTEAMFERLGVRLSYGRQKKRAWIRHVVGKGWEEWHADLADNLLVYERLSVLCIVWQALVSIDRANKPCIWGELDRYVIDPVDPSIRSYRYCWEPVPGRTVDDALAADAALRALYGAR